MATAAPDKVVRSDDPAARERDFGPRERERGGSTLWILAALVVAGLGLRSPILAIGPLEPQLAAGLGVTHAVTGLLATLPLALMGVSAVFATAIGDLLGDRLAIGLSLAAIAAGSVLRAVAPGIELILLLTVVIGAGIGVAGVLIPVFVKRRAPSRPAMATGLYVSGMIVGSSLTVSAAVPLSLALGGWRGALLLLGLITGVLAVTWLVLVESPGARPQVPLRLPRFPWRRPAAWLLVALFSLQSLIFFGLITWLVPALIERGWEATAAGAVTGAFSFCALPGSLLVTVVGDRVSRRSASVTASAVSFLALSGFVLAPDLAWLWAVLGGVSLGAIFALVMTLPLDAADRPQDAGDYTAMMLGAGYGIAAAAPALLGALRDTSGSFTSSLWLLAGMALLMFLSAPLVGRIRYENARADTLLAQPVAPPAPRHRSGDSRR